MGRGVGPMHFLMALQSSFGDAGYQGPSPTQPKDKGETNPRNSVVRSLVAGVKSLGTLT